MTSTYRSTSTGRRLSAGAAVAGLGLLASWLYVRARARRVEREHPPAGRFITVDGLKLHYLERGEGPVLVLLHGNGVDASDWEHSGLLDAAAEHYRVIAFDRPGFGYSERPRSTVWTPDRQARLLHHALLELNVDSAIVAGHSWGTLVALSLGLQAPDFVRGLVLVSGYYYPSARLDVMVGAPPAVPLVGDALRYTVAPLAGRLIWPAAVGRAFAPMPVAESFRATSPWMSLRPSQLRANAADSSLMIPGAASLARRYGRLKVPVQILAGTQDGVCSCARNAERLHAALRHSELSLTPGVGHMLHYAEPGKVLGAIDAVAAQVGGPGHVPTARENAVAAAGESGV
ncbi:alpha/beta fold hydrolase [Telluria beijingensis]|uniref:alpha/beta fold hydrolase n=1 Tax=Telluria beijingensis TaxID=3068633 RepID=UPI002796171C|nr:alpha/beta hydrolase [Massilia sp. REN29]